MFEADFIQKPPLLIVEIVSKICLKEITLSIRVNKIHFKILMVNTHETNNFKDFFRINEKFYLVDGRVSGLNKKIPENILLNKILYILE